MYSIHRRISNNKLIFKLFVNYLLMLLITSSYRDIQKTLESEYDLILSIIYDFKKSNEHGIQQICCVNRPISLNFKSNKCPVKLCTCFVTISITIKYCYKAVFIFLFISVYTRLGTQLCLETNICVLKFNLEFLN